MNWDWEKLQERRQRKPAPQPEDDGADFDKLIGKSVNKLQKMHFPWIKALLGLLVLLWIASGIFIVEPDEKGVVLRFGKFVRTVDPGPHYHLPFPIESVYTPKVEAVQRMEIGYGNDRARGGGTDEASMLTGDENIVFVQFVVQFRIDPEHPEYYLFNVADPLTTIRSASQASMREVMGSTEIDSAITDGRQQIEQRTKDILQGILDDYKAGIIITGVEMQDVHPPKEAIEAFMDVASAREDRSKIINQAEAYRNEILPKARGEAARTINEAEAYRQSVVLKADGESKRFLAVLEEYNKAKDVTAKRLYLEALESILSNPNVEKLILPESGVGPVLPYLPLGVQGMGQTSGTTAGQPGK
ncbi:MAG: FtsH protease activity modulator HflK [Desulfovibrionaceae bacterium]|nr:FtsH protease activity modulator HflK [Desulfovibrionaceae bacterium]